MRYKPNVTGADVTLEILQVPGCPGADLLAARLDGLLAGRLRVTRHVVTSQAEAERLGMTGSPTLLADGADPLARPGLTPSVSCRLYPDEHGRPGPAPPAGQLRAALGLLGRLRGCGTRGSGGGRRPRGGRCRRC